MRQICVTIAQKGAADFAVSSLIVELISSEGNWEAIMIGLKALLSIFMAAPARAADNQFLVSEVGSTATYQLTEELDGFQVWQPCKVNQVFVFPNLRHFMLQVMDVHTYTTM